MASLISSKISQGSGTSDGHFGDRDLETSKRLGNLTNLGNLAPGSRKSDTVCSAHNITTRTFGKNQELSIIINHKMIS